MVRTKNPAIENTTEPLEQKPNLGGRPRKEIDYKVLEEACIIHCTGEECASILDMSYETLDNHLIDAGHGGFLEFYKAHSLTGNVSLRRSQWYKAIEQDNTTMQIWLGKQNLGQSDRTKSEITGKDGGPVEQKITTTPVDWGQFTTEELQQLDQMNKRMAPKDNTD